MAMFPIGEASVDSALELALTGRPIAWLGATAEAIEANRKWMAPHFLEQGDTWSLNFRSWILRIGDKVVVIDPCTGNGRPHAMPLFDRLDVPFLERFEATGTRVEDVTHVFCTHLHHDHCGWNTMLRDGRWVPTFPRARYVFLRREYERWHPDNAARWPVKDFNNGVYARSVAPIVEAGLADLVLADHRLGEGLTVVAGHGHTPGHGMLHVCSAGAEAMFAGDALHHPLQLIAPEVPFGDAEDPVAAAAVRRWLAEQSLARDMLIVPAHLPAPHAGWVRRAADGGLWFEGLA